MRGASAKSQQEAVAAVEDALGHQADAASLGDELFGVVDLLDVEPSLRRILTDPAATQDAKAELVRLLFADKVSDPTAAVLTAAASGRWSRGRDLADALELAGATALLVGAESQGQLDEVEDELFRFGRVAHGNSELRGVLSDPAIPRERRRALAGALLEGRSTPWTVSLVSQALVARRRSFEATLTEFGEVAAQRRAQLVASVRAPYELDPQERQRLADALERTYGQPVHLNVLVDPAVLGGLSVEVGDEIIDATMSGRLEDARRRIAG